MELIVIILKMFPGVMENTLLQQRILLLPKLMNIFIQICSDILLHLLPEFRQAGCKIILDFSLNKNFDELAPGIKKYRFGFFSSKNITITLKNFLKKAHSFGPQIVTATFGTDGSMSYDGKKFYKQGIYPAEVVNTVGAGGFIYFWLYIRFNPGLGYSCLP